MAWPDEWFRWAESQQSVRRGFDVALAAVQDRLGPTPVRRENGPDHACCGEGILNLYDNALVASFDMFFSDRVDGGRTGALERWVIRFARDGAMSVSVPGWANWSARIPVDSTPLETGDEPRPVYVDLGYGHFVTGFMRTPSGAWHLAMSVDRNELQVIR